MIRAKFTYTSLEVKIFLQKESLHSANYCVFTLQSYLFIINPGKNIRAPEF